MVKQKHRYKLLMPVVQGFFYINWCGSIAGLPIKIWLHASKFHKLPIFSAFSHEKDPCTWGIKNMDILN
jgi:hypothetical protein